MLSKSWLKELRQTLSSGRFPSMPDDWCKFDYARYLEYGTKRVAPRPWLMHLAKTDNELYHAMCNKCTKETV